VRVIGGSARGRRLKAPAGVRPTSDLVRGAIFDVLEAHGADLSRVLDLYAGSGALGIEALSRGSAWCDFVERSDGGVAIIRENLETAGLAGCAKVHRLAAAKARERLAGPYTLILADPPYDDEGAPAVIAGLAESSLFPAGALLVFEHSSRNEAPEMLGPARVRWGRRYGDTSVSMYAQPEEGSH
jgi:16S rRNA (guanine966-N2)-methyltransferase